MELRQDIKVEEYRVYMWIDSDYIVKYEISVWPFLE